MRFRACTESALSLVRSHRDNGDGASQLVPPFHGLLQRILVEGVQDRRHSLPDQRPEVLFSPLIYFIRMEIRFLRKVHLGFHHVQKRKGVARRHLARLGTRQHIVWGARDLSAYFRPRTPRPEGLQLRHGLLRSEAPTDHAEHVKSITCSKSRLLRVLCRFIQVMTNRIRIGISQPSGWTVRKNGRPSSTFRGFSKYRRLTIAWRW